MLDGFKQVESSRFNVGESHAQWNLFLTCCQRRTDYCFVAFDGENKGEYIQSATVTAVMSNALEQAVIKTIQNPVGLETLDDVFKRLQDGFYGSMFIMMTTEGETE